jgi:hypothetical protein
MTNAPSAAGPIANTVAATPERAAAKCGLEKIAAQRGVDALLKGRAI